MTTIAAPPLACSNELGRACELGRPGGVPIRLGSRPLVMGVLNLTPDSFSDGGLWQDPEDALRHALRMVEAGADLLDLGAESTRPGGGVYGQGAEEIQPEEELERLLPVLKRLRSQVDIPLSVDTRRGLVAREALEAGADLINDISALADPLMMQVAARSECGIVLMHSRGELRTMQQAIHFENVTLEVRSELEQRVEVALEAGIRPDKIVIDPGIGFGKSDAQNLELLQNLDQLVATGHPVLLGASRKSFIAKVTGAGPDSRLAGSLAALAWAARAGAAIVRVHDVTESVQFLEVWQAIEQAPGRVTV